MNDPSIELKRYHYYRRGPCKHTKRFLLVTITVTKIQTAYKEDTKTKQCNTGRSAEKAPASVLIVNDAAEHTPQSITQS